MAETQERRSQHRRFSDRRVAALLAVHEVLFDTPPGPERQAKLLAVLQDDFGTDWSAFVTPLDGGQLDVLAATKGEQVAPPGTRIAGTGIEALVDIHRAAPGAVTLIQVRRPSVFSTPIWEDLWSEPSLGGKAKALLSVEIQPARASRWFLWMVQTGYSREWSSYDRELAEEVASLLARAADKTH